jgi:alpha-D-ribose 1-methylphosphonate 5-triphosphate diphosphatase
MEPEMPRSFCLANAAVVTGDEILDGSVYVKDGRIGYVESGDGSSAEGVPDGFDADGAISRGAPAGHSVLDLDGDYLLPGLIEMHTDNLERHLVPRPGVMWPEPVAGVLAHDLQLVGAGITTVLDALRIGKFSKEDDNTMLFGRALGAIRDAGSAGLLKAEHLLHLRCEMSDPGLREMFERAAGDPRVRLVSLMDHTPGQRQWRNLDKYRLYQRDKAWTDAEFGAHVAERIARQRQNAVPNRVWVLARCRDLNLPLATHDDTTEENVREAKAAGVRIAEFPTTPEAARVARREGIRVVAGAPNLVRGVSHSGNVSARELAEEGLLDGLSSDYMPCALLQGVFVLHREPGYALPAAVAMVSANVAAMLGLADRGEIAPGKRADLIRVGLHGDLPVVKAVWRGGRRVL